MTALLAASSLVAGAAFVGLHPVVNLNGELTSSGRMFALTLVSWLYCLLPVFAYTSVAILVSVTTRNGILGVLAPLMLALVDAAARPGRPRRGRAHAADRFGLRRLARAVRRASVLRPDGRVRARLAWYGSRSACPCPGGCCGDATSSPATGRGELGTAAQSRGGDGRGDRGAGDRIGTRVPAR